MKLESLNKIASFTSGKHYFLMFSVLALSSIILSAGSIGLAADGSKQDRGEKTERETSENEKLEDQIESFLYAKIKGNSLVLLKEKHPSDSKQKGTEKSDDDKNLFTRVKIPTDAVVTGISCKGLYDFFKNEGLKQFEQNIQNTDISITSLIRYFKDKHIKKHFSNRTLKILKDDMIKQIPEALKQRRLPIVCFAEIKESSVEKHIVYLNHEIISKQTEDYSPEYTLIDFTYDDHYLSYLYTDKLETKK